MDAPLEGANESAGDGVASPPGNPARDVRWSGILRAADEMRMEVENARNEKEAGDGGGGAPAESKGSKMETQSAEGCCVKKSAAHEEEQNSKGAEDKGKLRDKAEEKGGGKDVKEEGEGERGEVVEKGSKLSTEDDDVERDAKEQGKKEEKGVARDGEEKTRDLAGKQNDDEEDEVVRDDQQKSRKTRGEKHKKDGDDDGNSGCESEDKPISPKSKEKGAPKREKVREQKDHPREEEGDGSHEEGLSQKDEQNVDEDKKTSQKEKGAVKDRESTDVERASAHESESKDKSEKGGVVRESDSSPKKEGERKPVAKAKSLPKKVEAVREGKDAAGKEKKEKETLSEAKTVVSPKEKEGVKQKEPSRETPKKDSGNAPPRDGRNSLKEEGVKHSLTKEKQLKSSGKEEGKSMAKEKGGKSLPKEEGKRGITAGKDGRSVVKEKERKGVGKEERVKSPRKEKDGKLVSPDQEGKKKEAMREREKLKDGVGAEGKLKVAKHFGKHREMKSRLESSSSSSSGSDSEKDPYDFESDDDTRYKKGRDKKSEKSERRKEYSRGNGRAGSDSDDGDDSQSSEDSDESDEYRRRGGGKTKRRRAHGTEKVRRTRDVGSEEEESESEDEKVKKKRGYENKRAKRHEYEDDEEYDEPKRRRLEGTSLERVKKKDAHNSKGDDEMEGNKAGSKFQRPGLKSPQHQGQLGKGRLVKHSQGEKVGPDERKHIVASQQSKVSERKSALNPQLKTKAVLVQKHQQGSAPASRASLGGTVSSSPAAQPKSLGERKQGFAGPSPPQQHGKSGTLEEHKHHLASPPESRALIKGRKPAVAAAAGSKVALLAEGKGRVDKGSQTPSTEQYNSLLYACWRVLRKEAPGMPMKLLAERIRLEGIHQLKRGAPGVSELLKALDRDNYFIVDDGRCYLEKKTGRVVKALDAGSARLLESPKAGEGREIVSLDQEGHGTDAKSPGEAVRGSLTEQKDSRAQSETPAPLMIMAPPSSPTMEEKDSVGPKNGVTYQKESRKRKKAEEDGSGLAKEEVSGASDVADDGSTMKKGKVSNEEEVDTESREKKKVHADSAGKEGKSKGGKTEEEEDDLTHGDANKRRKVENRDVTGDDAAKEGEERPRHEEDASNNVDGEDVERDDASRKKKGDAVEDYANDGSSVKKKTDVDNSSGAPSPREDVRRKKKGDDEHPPAGASPSDEPSKKKNVEAEGRAEDGNPRKKSQETADHAHTDKVKAKKADAESVQDTKGRRKKMETEDPDDSRGKKKVEVDEQRLPDGVTKKKKKKMQQPESSDSEEEEEAMDRSVKKKEKREKEHKSKEEEMKKKLVSPKSEDRKARKKQDDGIEDGRRGGGSTPATAERAPGKKGRRISAAPDEVDLPDDERCTRSDGRAWRCREPRYESKSLCLKHYEQTLKKRGTPKAEKAGTATPKVEKAKGLKSPKSVGRGPGKGKEVGVKDPGTGATNAAVSKVCTYIREASNKQCKRDALPGQRFCAKHAKKAQRRAHELAALEKQDREGHTSNDEAIVDSRRRGKGGSGAVSPRDAGDGRGLRKENQLKDDAAAQQRERTPIKGDGSLNSPVGKKKNKLSRMCHQCQRNDKGELIFCDNCENYRYCTSCIKKWYPAYSESDLQKKCPKCRGNCNCSSCLNKRIIHEVPKLSVEQRRRYQLQVLGMLMPHLRELHVQQEKELSIEAEKAGGKKVDIKQMHLESDEQITCDNCCAAIVDLHRSCPKCGFDVCLECVAAVRAGGAPKRWHPVLANSREDHVDGEGERTREPPVGGDDDRIDNKGRKRKGHLDAERRTRPRKDEADSGSLEEGDDDYLEPELRTDLPPWTAVGEDKMVPCPPKERGGCGGANLELKTLLGRDWISKLKKEAEEVLQATGGAVAASDNAANVRSDPCECVVKAKQAGKLGRYRGVLEEAEDLMKAAGRPGGDDDVLYCPHVSALNVKAVDKRVAMLNHFQLHWKRGEPVVVRGLLDRESGISWDPTVVWRAAKKRQKDDETSHVVDAIDCLDWCEVQLSVPHFFAGYLQGRMYVSGWPEILKLKDWPPPSFFEKRLPRHYADFVDALPCHEYTNPSSGIFNLVSRVPLGTAGVDLSPKAYVAYGMHEELGVGDSVTKLHYDPTDVVNVLLHSAEVPIPAWQRGRIQILKSELVGEKAGTAILHDKFDATKHRGLATPERESEEDRGTEDGPNDKGHARDRKEKDVTASKIDAENGGPVEGLGKDRQNDKKELAEGEQKGRSNDAATDQDLGEYGGAVWDVFRREDIGKLEEYLREHWREFRHLNNEPLKRLLHPIYDQTFFLTEEHKLKLKEEKGIEPWTFQQHLGDAVLVPAGCPHQVRNMKSCFKLAMEFVSPENVHECIRIADGTRMLPKSHAANESKLQVKRLMLHAVKSALEELTKVPKSTVDAS
ncbi:hypothetical protein CBR_g54325 [Chara braunii]|uniref:RING-type domain-containing protein n=1 Tax=Chara braunii TaxID=69332 RepID=A0A388MBY0_CHABU|nr:hypothetical protein CBR_g54325 [Chara braunii]|eukprot:GBG92070.1 hypothetical protein CBR_g54325 [Chara braunii]